ncbi:MAG: mechanosensitive ion channel family protein [Firmicutes bacterium]|nr:mechanosensitive ion channel family protein [Bacillota bacterium]
MNFNVTEKIFSFLSGGLKKAIMCAIIIFACYLFYKIAKKMLNRMAEGKSSFPGMNMEPKKAKTLSSISENLLKFFLAFIAIFSILVYLGVPATSLAAVAGIGTVAIGFGCQSLAKDMVSGLFITMEDQFHIGDMVKIKDIVGTVEMVTMRTTTIRGADGTQYIIPNGDIGVVANMCKEYMYAVVVVSVAYEENLDRVMEVLNDEMDKAAVTVPGLVERPTVLGVSDLGASSVDIKITAKCMVKENLGIERQLRYRIKNRLDAEGISIPFPQMTIHNAQNVLEEKPHEELKEMTVLKGEE